MAKTLSAPTELFYCYAHADEALRVELEKHLSLLHRQGLLTSWHDRDIQAGTEWKQEIDNHLNTASLILLLIGPDFLASDYCYNIEMSRAIERQRAGDAQVIPILLRPVDWRGTPFSHLHVLPTNARPITSWGNQDEAFENVAQGIRHAISHKHTQSIPQQQDIVVSAKQVASPLASSHPFFHSTRQRAQKLPASSMRFALLGLGVLLILGLGTKLIFTMANNWFPSPKVLSAATPTASATTYSSYDSYVQAHGIQFSFDAAHTGFNSYEHTLNPSNVKNLVQDWTAQTSGQIGSSPTVANGIVYVGSEDHKLYAFPANGCNASSPCQPLWTGQTGGQIDSSPAIANGIVYVGSEDHEFYAFPANKCNASSPCQPLWTAQTNGNIDSSPAVANGVVYVGSDDQMLYAFPANKCNASSPCQPLWTAQTNGFITSSPAVANGVVYVTSRDRKLYAFQTSGCNISPCKPLWTAQTGGQIDSSPTVANGVVYVGSEDDKLYAFQVSKCNASSPCQPLWTAQTGNPIYSSPTIANGIVYIASHDRKIYAFQVNKCNASSLCQPFWTAQAQDNFFSSPTIANGVVYIGSYDQNLYAFQASGCNASSCLPLWVARTGDKIYSSPAVANGVVYVGSDDHKLYAFHLKT